MNTLNKYLVIIFLFIFGMKAELMAQPSYSIDSSFIPFLDFRLDYINTGGPVSDLWENPANGNVYLTGFFNQTHNGKVYFGNVCYTPDGSLCPDYNGYFGRDLQRIFPINDTTLVVTKSRFIRHIDFNGNLQNLNLFYNRVNSAPCRSGSRPYVYKDGSFLLTNGLGSTLNGCSPRIQNDTFPHRFFVKVDPYGVYDTTFQHNTNHQPTGFIPYDSNRLFVYGLNHRMTQYDGVTVNGFCRIFLNGDLDTTFDNPILPINNYYDIELVDEKSGKFFIIGQKFALKNYPNQLFYIARFNSDGTLDTTFMTTGLEDTNNRPEAGINTITKTEDNGYLISGFFDKYQGYVKNGLVKLDSTGKIEPQYFNNFIGPDSGITRWAEAQISGIKPSINGGYYIYGDWKYWDGEPSQPIIKIHGLSVGLNENKQSSKTKLVQSVYPNPTNSLVNIEWLPNQQINQLQLIDIQGRIIQDINQNLNQSNSYQISLENVNNGIYFLKVFGKNGVETKKLVKR